MESESWSPLENTCDSRGQTGLTPTGKITDGIKPNEMAYVDNSSQLLLNYKNAVLQNGFSHFYPSFVNAIGKYAHFLIDKEKKF